MALKAIILLAILIWAAPSKAGEYIATKNSCEAMQKRKSRWRKTTVKLTRGKVYRGNVLPSRRGLIIRKNRKLFAVKLRCFKKKPSRKRKKREGAPKWNESYLTVGLSFLNWQEPLKLKSASEEFDLLSSHIGICVGPTWHKPLSIWFEAGATGCGFFALSEAAETSEANSPSAITYRAKRSRVFGALAGPYILWSPTRDSFQLGAVVPIIYRTGNWPNPEGFEVSPGGTLAPGFFLESRIGRKTYALSLKVGFYRSISSLSWYLTNDFRF